MKQQTIEERIKNAYLCVFGDKETRMKAIDERRKEIYRIVEYMKTQLLTLSTKEANIEMYANELRQLREIEDGL